MLQRLLMSGRAPHKNVASPLDARKVYVAGGQFIWKSGCLRIFRIIQAVQTNALQFQKSHGLVGSRSSVLGGVTPPWRNPSTTTHQGINASPPNQRQKVCIVPGTQGLQKLTSRRFERLTFRRFQENWNLTRYHCATWPDWMEKIVSKMRLIPSVLLPTQQLDEMVC